MARTRPYATAQGDTNLICIQTLVNILEQFSESEILSFDEIFHDLLDEAYTTDLWDVAYIIGCGCGDSSFVDFRSWLIGQGKNTFEKALVDPESLVDIVEIGQEKQVGDGSLWTAYIGAWERQGKDLDNMPKRIKPPAMLKGKSREEAETLARFPRVTEKFWKRCL